MRKTAEALGVSALSQSDHNIGGDPVTSDGLLTPCHACNTIMVKACCTDVCFAVSMEVPQQSGSWGAWLSSVRLSSWLW
jgi:hypothetical protein